MSYVLLPAFLFSNFAHKGTILFGTISDGLGDVLSLSKCAELSGGIPIAIGIWQGVATGLIVSGLNHWAHMMQEPKYYFSKWFATKEEAYEYAMQQGHDMFLGDREVSGWIFDNDGGYIVLDPLYNTKTTSKNDQLKTRINNGKMQVKYMEVWFDIKGHFHTHPYHPYPSGKDLYNLYESFAPNNISAYILYDCDEYQYFIGNQYQKTYNDKIYNYSLQNNGSW